MHLTQYWFRSYHSFFFGRLVCSMLKFFYKFHCPFVFDVLVVIFCFTFQLLTTIVILCIFLSRSGLFMLAHTIHFLKYLVMTYIHLPLRKIMSFVVFLDYYSSPSYETLILSNSIWLKNGEI